MAEPSEKEVLLQARVRESLYNRFTQQRERWGMSNAELLDRLLTDVLPRWEAAQGPPVQPQQ